VDDSIRKTIVKDIFNNFPDIKAGCKNYQISLGSYYQWKNKLFPKGKGLKKTRKMRKNTSEPTPTFQDIQDYDTNVNVKSTNRISIDKTLEEENSFLWKKVTELLVNNVR